jgi:hypothetical protein
MEMTKRNVRRALGFRRDIELARFFGVSKGAVSQWPEGEAIPEVRQWQAKAKRPDLFGDESIKAA